MVYGSQDVKCPFYKDETRNTIRCEGIFSNAISNNFERALKKNSHKSTYCCKDYQSCPLYKSVYAKYI